ncbi:hypothetical protein AMECASPLE_032465 [Ameca splendens]|uniref:Uncharacterized protein n=1 Tax=Ameca splendens TaxID=208324 RepID=A0ABV1A459_9TELE
MWKKFRAELIVLHNKLKWCKNIAKVPRHPDGSKVLKLKPKGTVAAPTGGRKRKLLMAATRFFTGRWSETLDWLKKTCSNLVAAANEVSVSVGPSKEEEQSIR